jgi:hypothetical protein
MAKVRGSCQKRWTWLHPLSAFRRRENITPNIPFALHRLSWKNDSLWYLVKVENSPRASLVKLWKTASLLQDKITSRSPENDGGLAIASALSWLLPNAQIQAVYSVPMGVLEMFALRVGGWTVGLAGAWPSGEYAKQVHLQKLVNAPCRVKPAHLQNPSSLLTEAISRTPEFQKMELVS